MVIEPPTQPQVDSRELPLPVVKICGVRTVEGASSVASAGADFAGLLLVPGRRRTVSVERAARLIPEFGSSTPIGVVLDQELHAVLDMARLLKLGWLQLHGNEPPDYVARLAEAGLKLVKVLSVGTSGFDAGRARAYSPHVEAFLLDGALPGSGELLPLDCLPAPNELGRPVWLAGGLRPGNVGLRLRATRFTGADVASGVERDGDMVPELVHQFVERAKEAFAS